MCTYMCVSIYRRTIVRACVRACCMKERYWNIILDNLLFWNTRLWFMFIIMGKSYQEDVNCYIFNQSDSPFWAYKQCYLLAVSFHTSNTRIGRSCAYMCCWKPLRCAIVEFNLMNIGSYGKSNKFWHDTKIKGINCKKTAVSYVNSSPKLMPLLGHDDRWVPGYSLNWSKVVVLGITRHVLYRT